MTFIGYFSSPYRIIFGTKEGCVTIYNMVKKEIQSFSMEPEKRAGMSSILQVVELPTKIADVRKNIYYILTYGNLYAMSKEEGRIQQVFYKGDRSLYHRPRML